MRRQRKGLTLAELVMAIAVTAVIGLVISGVSVALTNAYASTQNFYKCLSSARSAMINIQAAIKDAKLVTLMGDGSMVLWTADMNSDGAINLSELTVLKRDSESNRINEYSISYPESFTKDMKKALDSKLTLAEAMQASIISTITNSQYAQTQTLAQDATAFSVSADVQAPLTTLVKIELAVADETDEGVTLRSAASLRAPFTEYVGIADGEYVVNLPSSMVDDDSDDASADSGDSNDSGGSGGSGSSGHGGRGNWWWWR